MEGTASAVCEILRYLIIYWKCETGLSKGALLEGQLMISIEAINSKHQPNGLHCVTTIASARSICGGLVLKKLQKEIQSILPGFSAKLTLTSGEGSYSLDTSGATSFQMIFEVDEKPRTLMTDCLVIKHFLRKIIIIHHKIRFNFSVKVNGILSTEIFGAEDEPILNLWNGIALVVSYQRYVSNKTPPDIFNDPVVSSSLQHLYVFLYGPSGLPLTSNREQPSTTVLKDICYFIDWKKYHLCMVPNLDLNLDGGVHTLLTAQLHAILMESHSAVQESIQAMVDHVLEQHHQAAKANQKLQASLSVAVNSVMSVVTGSTNSSFRKTCLQALQAADTQELGTKLHKIFHDVTQHRFLHHCSCDVKQQLTPKKKDSAQNTEDAHENSPELLAEISGQAENKRLKRGSLHQSVEEMEAPHSANAPRRLEPTAASLTVSRAERRAVHVRAPAPDRASPRSVLEDALWLQEVSNLSEWLSPGHGS